MPIVAVFVLVVVLQQTSSALKASGMWQPRTSKFHVPVEDPYTRIDNLLASRTAVDPQTLRNPFAFGSERAPVAAATHITPRHTARDTTSRATPPAEPQPVLTSIVWAATPSATIRYQGKDFSVTENSLFADFTVKNITRTEVILDRNGQTLTLTFRPKGEPQ